MSLVPSNYTRRNQSTVPYQGPTLPKQDANFYRSTGQNRNIGGDVLSATDTQYQGGGTSVNTGSGIPQQNFQSVLEQIPQQNGIDYDALIAPALQGLEGAMGASESAYGANVQSIDANASRQVGDAQASLQGAENRAGEYKQKHTQTTESAIDEARRQFSEQQQGIQARYGGTTGTGAFASQISGAQSLKSIAGYRQNLQSAIQGIDNKLEEVRGTTQIVIQDIQTQSQAQKSQAKAQLDQALNQIRQQRGEIQSRKAELASQAIQIYQNSVNEINARNQQFLQQVAMQQASAENQLTMAKQRAGKAAEEFSLFSLPQGNTLLKVNQDNTQATPIYGGGRLDPNQNPDSQEVNWDDPNAFSNLSY